MKKILTGLMMIACLGLVSPSFALDGTGTIEEVITCGYGSGGWRNMVLFRLSDGNWFGG